MPVILVTGATSGIGRDAALRLARAGLAVGVHTTQFAIRDPAVRANSGASLRFESTSFQPKFAGGHKQTLYAWARRRRFPPRDRPTLRSVSASAIPARTPVSTAKPG